MTQVEALPPPPKAFGYGSRIRRFIKLRIVALYTNYSFLLLLRQGYPPIGGLPIEFSLHLMFSPFRQPADKTSLVLQGLLPVTTMTSADFLAHRSRIYSKTSPANGIFLPPISIGSIHKAPVGFPTFGRQYGVLPYPTLPASVSRSCSVGPRFVPKASLRGSLPSFTPCLPANELALC